MPTLPLSQRPLAERGYIALHRRSRVEGRYPVVLLARDRDALDAATGSRRSSDEALRQLIREGRLQQVRRGVYLLVAPTGTVETDVAQIIDAITPRPYLITAGRALSIAGLSDQHFFTVIVLTTGRLRSWGWRGDTVRYATTHGAHLWGSASRKGSQVACPQRALLDALAQPRWGVSLPQITEALDLGLSRDKLPPQTLGRAARRYDNASVSRRLGFLVSLVAGAEAASDLLALRGRAKAAALLAPRAPATGPVDPTWMVRVNVDSEHLLAHRMVG